MAVSESAPAIAADLTQDQLRSMYRDMVLGRLLDERILVLNRQGRAPFAISGQGHEAAQVGVGYALRRGHDGPPAAAAPARTGIGHRQGGGRGGAACAARAPWCRATEWLSRRIAAAALLAIAFPSGVTWVERDAAHVRRA